MALASLQVGLVSLLQELDCAQGLPTALAGQEPGLHLDQLPQDTQRFASTLVPWKARVSPPRTSLCQVQLENSLIIYSRG